MKIELKNIGKKFSNEWIFKNLSFEFASGKKYAVTGFNGSGKSTLIQVAAGLIPCNLGEVIYIEDGVVIPSDEIYKKLFITAPYIDLVEEFSLSEALDFHTKFKPFKEGISKEKFLELVYMKQETAKTIKQFSSGMKQRLKLGLAFFSQSNALFLDEPTTNLDEQGIQWYLDKVSNLESSKLVIISSNDKREYNFCDQTLNINDFKVS